MGWVSIMQGSGDKAESFALFEMWGFGKPTDEAALVASVAKSFGITNVISGKLWNRRSYYDLQEKLQKSFPKNDRSTNRRQSASGTVIISASNPNEVAQKFDKFLSNDYRTGTIPKSTARFKEPQLLGSIIVACGPKDATMTSFKVYEWWGTGLPRNNSERYGKLNTSVTDAVGSKGDNECKMNDTVTGLTGAAAQEAFYRRIKGIRKWVSASVANMRITTDDDCKVVSVSPAGGGPRGTLAGGGGSSSTSSSSGGIQVSSADMSGYTRNFLGCLAFTYSSMSFLYVVPVYGPSFSIEKHAPAIARQYDMATSYHKYQWFPGRSASSLEKEFGKSYSVRVNEPYTIE